MNFPAIAGTDLVMAHALRLRCMSQLKQVAAPSTHTPPATPLGVHPGGRAGSLAACCSTTTRMRPTNAGMQPETGLGSARLLRLSKPAVTDRAAHRRWEGVPPPQ